MSKSKLWTWNFVIITITNFFLFFAFQLFPSALPPYLKSLGAADNMLGWLQGILTVATLIVRPFAGLALDRYGRKGIFIVGLIGMLLSTAAYRFFPVVGIIFVIRFVHGMVWGVANTACSTVATDNIEKTRFAESMGYFSLTSSIAMAVAPAVALSLGMQNNVLLALAFLSITIILAFLIKYQNLPVEQTKKRKAPYAKESLLPSLIMVFFSITFGAILTFIALYGAQRSIEGVGLFFTVYAVSMLLTRPFLGKLIDNKGFGAGVWPGVVMVPAALLLLSISDSLIAFLICGAVYGIGIGAAQASLQTMAIVNVPKDRTGAANATFFTGFDGGIGIGAVLAGFVSTIWGYGGMFAFMAIFPVLAGIVYFVTLKRNQSQRI
ncbi:MAG: MFS transporter [Eubacteriales bacterium]|nr:MFS transporter [Eubacteriales bacterium]MDD4513036.1 MFS transporter [Eubacteriales bacterium]